jgi:DNA repair exonuclease SbcCD ATPase subunit
MQEIERVHTDKKKQYDHVVMNLDQEKEKMDQDIKQVFKDYVEDERKFHYNNIQTEIYDAFLKRIGNEAKFQSQPEKRLTNEFKSYSEYFNAKLRQQENIVKDLKAHQKHIKDNAENYAEQMSLFRNLKQLLEVKRRAGKDGDGDLIGYQDSNAQGFDRFVVRD